MKVLFLFDSFCDDGKPDFNVSPYKRHHINQKLENTLAFTGWYFVKPYDCLTFNNNIKSDTTLDFAKTIDFYNNRNKYDHDLVVYPIFTCNDELGMPWQMKYLSKIIVELVNQNEIKIAMINFFESDRYDNIWRTMSYYEYFCNKLKIYKKNNIFIIGNDININELPRQYPKDHFRFIVSHGVIRYFLDKIYSLNIDTTKYIENYINKSDKEKVFLSMVNHGRTSKYFTHQYLRYNNCLKNSFYSYIHEDHYDNHKSYPIDDLYSQFPIINEELDKYPDFKKFIIDNPNIGKHFLPQDYLNTNHHAYNVSNQVVYLNDYWTCNTYFSVINETHFNDLASWITEKTFKMFYYGHPFILVGGRNVLKHLREMGFQTFPELFDESYDSMPCNLDKLMFICDQIKYYNTEEGIQKLKKITPTLKDKLLYNRNHFINYDWNQIWKKLL